MTENAVHASPVAAADTPMTSPHSVKRESFGTRHRRSFIVVIVIGLLMAIPTPLQTNFIPFWHRLAYWEILMLSGALIGLGATEGVEHWGKLRRWQWLEILVTGLLIALPLTMIVIGTGHIFFGASSPGVIRYSYNFGVTAIISVSITALNHMLSQRRAEIAAAPAPNATPPLASTPNNRFADRLPLPLRSKPIQAIAAEDHYLRVYFDDGQSTLILLRLSDALAELPQGLGEQTHRSWWVAKDAVRKIAKADGRATLTLDHGIEAPVSRSFYRTLADKGWFNGLG